MRIPLAMGPSYRSQSLIASVARSMNFYPERIEVPGGKNQWVLYPTPGVSAAKATFSESPGKGIFEDRGRLFTVQGQQLYELDSSYTKTARGSAMARDGNPATLSSNGDGGDEVFITAGDEGYILDLGTNLVTNEVSNVTMGDHLDGYFLALDGDSSTFKISDLLDGKTWDATQFVQRSDASDPWKSMVQQGGEIWLIGSKTGGVWYNSGASPFPFELRTESFFERGIVAPFTLKRFDHSVIWLGANEDGHGVVYRASGYSPVRVSDHAVEYAIQGYSTISDAEGWVYEDQGHSFYILSFPTADRTWVFDSATQAWHERGFLSQTSGVFKRYRPHWHALAFGKHVVCDALIGAVYEMGITHYTDVGSDPLRRERIMPAIHNEHRQVIHDELRVELERGIGLITGQGSNPLVMMRYSDDGGRTWSNEREASAGAIGNYRARVVFRRLGLARDRVYWLAFSDPVPWRLVDAYVDARPATH